MKTSLAGSAIFSKVKEGRARACLPSVIIILSRGAWGVWTSSNKLVVALVVRKE